MEVTGYILLVFNLKINLISLASIWYVDATFYIIFEILQSSLCLRFPLLVNYIFGHGSRVITITLGIIKERVLIREVFVLQGSWILLNSLSGSPLILCARNCIHFLHEGTTYPDLWSYRIAWYGNMSCSASSHAR